LVFFNSLIDMQKKMLKNNIKPIGYNKILGNEIGKNTDHENFGVFFYRNVMWW